MQTRDLLVETAMTTMRHQYFATLFLSKDKINEIMKKNAPKDLGNSDESAICTINSSDTGKAPILEDTVQLVNLSTDRYKAYMLIVTNPARVIMGVPDTLGVKGEQLWDIAKKYDSLGGINAGGFQDDGGTGNGGTPIGLLVQNGNLLYGNKTESYDIIGINKDNILVLGKFTYNDILSKNIVYATSFSPFLIVNGQSAIVNGSTGGGGLQPRTVIGQRKDGTILMLVIDGRQASSEGATLKACQDIMLQYDAYNAANLDGGSSTIMYYDSKIINHPCSPAGPRPLPCAFLIKR